MFFDFIRMQAPLVFITCLYGGAGMICNDFRNNLMEVYFSKPLTWRDYVIGKVVTLVLLGLSLTALPILILLVSHNVLVPSWELLNETFWWGVASVAFSFVVVLPTILTILASSALMHSQAFASIAIFMVLVADFTMGIVLQEVLHERNYLIISFPMAMNRVGQFIFDKSNVMFPLDWKWSMLFVVAVCVIGLFIVCRRVRRAEVGV